MSDASHLTQAGYRQLRNAVANAIVTNQRQGIYTIPEPEHFLLAERLIDAGVIDVSKVMGLPDA